jgi:hypothetical protein
MDVTLFRHPETPLTETQKLLRKQVAEQVTDDRAHFDMHCWSTTAERTCDTVACLAGWAVHLSGQNAFEVKEVDSAAILLLGLTRREYVDDRTGPLFFASEEEAIRRMQALAEAS